MVDRRRGLVFGEGGAGDVEEWFSFQSWAERTLGRALAGTFEFATFKNTPQYQTFIREVGDPRAAERRGEFTFPTDIGEGGQLGFGIPTPEGLGLVPGTPQPLPTQVIGAQEPETFISGGFTFQKFTAPDGTVSFAPIGQAPREDTGITEFQQGQLGIQRERLDFERAAAEQNRINALRTQFGGQAEQRAILGAQRNRFDIESGVRADFARQFEALRAQLMRRGPRGFFANQLLSPERLPNPFAPQREDASVNVIRAEESLKRAETSLNTVLKRATAVEKRASDPNDPLTRSGIANPSTNEEFRAAALFRERSERGERVDQLSQALGRAEDALETELGTFASTQPASAPNEPRRERPGIAIPRELSEFLPEGLGGRFVTPSAQAFGRLGFTERERLLGAAEVRGEQPTDILEDIQRPLSRRRRGGRVAPISFV